MSNDSYNVIISSAAAAFASENNPVVQQAADVAANTVYKETYGPTANDYGMYVDGEWVDFEAENLTPEQIADLKNSHS